MRGHIRPRGKDTWAIVVDVGRGPDGKRRQRWVTVRGTKKKAEARLTELLRNLDTNEYIEPAKLTVAEYLQRWLEEHVKPNASLGTYERYASVVDLHLAPEIGGTALAKLQPLHIQALYRKLAEGHDLGAPTVLLCHRVLHAALKQAVRWQLLLRNPADAVTPPRAKRDEAVAPDEDATARLLEAARSHWLHPIVVLAATTGMRRGEICGLHWSDVDLKAKTVTVRQALEPAKGGPRLQDPKTAKGRRVIALPALAVDALKAHELKQKRTRMALGPAYKDQGFVVCNADGTPFQPGAVSQAFGALARRLGLDDVHLHSLRHGHASHLLRSGVPAKVISERLGHSSIRITLDVYSHLMPGMDEDAAQRIDAALRTAMRSRQ